MLNKADQWSTKWNENHRGLESEVIKIDDLSLKTRTIFMNEGIVGQAYVVVMKSDSNYWLQIFHENGVQYACVWHSHHLEDEGFLVLQPVGIHTVV